MDTRDLKKRLNALHHRHPTSLQEDKILFSRDLSPARTARDRVKPPLSPLLLQDAVEGEEIRHASGGAAFVVENHVSQLAEIREPPCGRLERMLADPQSGARQWIDTVSQTCRVAPEDLLFLDLETTGLGSTPLFLIGTMTWVDDGLVVRQFFARDYSEEKIVLSLYGELVEKKQLLVSFNGKTFDVPYVQTRAAAHGVSWRTPKHHLDLLHVSRRIWRRRLPNCKLQTLEQYVCGRNRSGDIPGSEIPRAYHDFVRTKDAWEMVDCLKHNMLDLVTLADLMVRLPPP